MENNENYSHQFTNDELELNEYYDINTGGFSFASGNYCTTEMMKLYAEYPMTYHNELIDISIRKYSSFGYYGQVVSKMTSAPTLDYVVIPSKGNAKKQKKILAECSNILNSKMNHLATSRDAIMTSILCGEYVGLWRDTKGKRNSKRPSNYAGGDKIEAVSFMGDNAMIQPLDVKYCRFEGVRNGDNVVSFDMSYFDQFVGRGNLVGEIKNYPEFFLRGYNAYRKDSSKRWLLLPQEITFSYKYHAMINEAHGRPLIAFSLDDVLFAEDYTEAKRNNMYTNANKLNWYKLPQGKEVGSCALNDGQQKSSYRAFKNAINRSHDKQNIGRSIPLLLPQGAEVGTLNVGDTFLKNTLTQENNTSVSLGLGVSDGLFACSGDKVNYATLQKNIDLMLSEVYSMLDQFSIQYTKLLNNYLGLEGKDMIRFSYLHTSMLTKNEDFEKYKDLYNVAGGSRRLLYSAAYGDAELYMQLMEFEKEMGYDEMYKPHMTSYNSSSKDINSDKGGRPPSDESDLSEGGTQTRLTDANNIPKASK